MTAQRPPGRQQQATPEEEMPPPSSAVERANRMSAANMIRSLALLVALCLALVLWLAFVRQDGDRPVRSIDPGPSVTRAAEFAAYPLQAPELPEGYRATDTDVVGGPGDPVTLQIDIVTPAEQYVAFVTSDDSGAAEVRSVLDGAEPAGAVDVAGREWTRSTTARGETALSREEDGVTVLVTGSASDEEMRAVLAALRTVAGAS